MESCVYFVQARQTGYIKIGLTKNLPKRMEALRTSAAEGIELLIHCNGASRRHELALHDQFQDARVQGEWFRPVPTLLAAIERLRASRGSDRLMEYDALKHAMY